jgi:DNA-binding transcriptional LysR family regulator
MLEIKRLAMFHAVAEGGSFSEAALTLGYAQSVVSHHVAQLERELGVTLFERARRPVRLTPAGERLHGHTGTILGAIRAAQADMHALAGMESGLVRMGAFLSACATFVPSAMGTFRAAHPGVEVRLEQQEPPAALPRLIAGELDLVVAWVQYGDDAPPDPRLEQVPLGLDPYRIVVPAAHRLARRRELRIADLAGETFNGPRPVAGGLVYQQMLERLCADAGFAPHIGYLVDDVTVARALVAAGLCVALMPELTVPHPRPDIAVKAVRGVEPFRTVRAFRLKGRRAPGVAAMTRALQEAAKAVLPPVPGS